MNEVVIAVDPGREKCGVAVVDRQAGVQWKKVVNTGELAAAVGQLAQSRGANTVVVGDRTAHQAVVRALKTVKVNDRELIIIAVDEHRSTEEARSRYWRENPPRGIKRFIPVTMLIPPEPVDDYVAIILAERYFRQ